jgi:hypothetical protein
VPLLLDDRFGEQFARAVVTHLVAERDAGVEPVDGLGLTLHGEADLLEGVLTDLDRAETLQVGVPLEVEDAVHVPVRVLHLLERDRLEAGGQPGQPPVVEHPVVEPVLVDQRQLVGEHVVEQLDDPVVAHGVAPVGGWSWPATLGADGHAVTCQAATTRPRRTA